MTIFVSKTMDALLTKNSNTGLERSCAEPGDWIRLAPPRPGIERLEAAFSGHAYDPHRHDTYAIGYTLRGVQCFHYRGSDAVSTAGNVLVLHPDEMHDGHAGTAAGFRYRMLYIEPRLVQDALGDGWRGLPFVKTPVFTDPHLVSCLVAALDDFDRPLDDLLASQVIAALADGLARHEGHAATPPKPATAALRQARDYLEENMSRTVTSAELERVSGLDRYQLARQFRLFFGTSPYRYLVMRRLARARRLIAGGTGLADAAYEAGFADQSHLTRHFKQAFGVTPGRWSALLV
jgi:AraC-like DNA-binding protein